MSVTHEKVQRTVGLQRSRLIRRDLPWQKRVAFMAAIYIAVFSACFMLAEIGFRIFWNPKYWIHTSRLFVGSGQTEAGKKWWPQTVYSVESSEFRAEFRTNAQGYRARRGPTPPTAYRIAFVGDSFTEGMQVAYATTFGARLEKLLAPPDVSRAVVCENFGVSATDLLEYWHRIIHDVIANNPPDALVLCIYPGNDFQGGLPDEAFDQQDRPLRDFYRKPAWSQHVIAWVNLHSKFGSYAQRAILSMNGGAVPSQNRAPRNWWADPALAARSGDALAVRRSRSILQAIDAECRKRGTKLCILVVGPVATYAAVNGESPLSTILASWGLAIPVIDVAIKARAVKNRQALTFPIDGHLTESGHTYIACETAPALQALLTADGRIASRSKWNIETSDVKIIH